MEIDHWQRLFGEYLETLQFSERTVESYVGCLRFFLEFLRARGLESLSGLTRAHLEEYRTELFYTETRGKRLAIRTQQCRLGMVRTFVRYLVRYDYLLVDVAAGLEYPRAPQTLPRVLLTERETVTLLEAPDVQTRDGIRDRSVLEMLYATGLRNSELSALKLDDIDWGHHTVRVEMGKGGKSRVVPMGQEAEVWLEEYLRLRPQL